jgi:hypothetical protein
LGASGDIEYYLDGPPYVAIFPGGADYSANTWYCLQVEWRGSGASSEVRYQLDSNGWTSWIAPAYDWTTGLDIVWFEADTRPNGGSAYYDNICSAPLVPSKVYAKEFKLKTLYGLEPRVVT